MQLPVIPGVERNLLSLGAARDPFGRAQGRLFAALRMTEGLACLFTRHNIRGLAVPGKNRY
jgi:hypothetical protein